MPNWNWVPELDFMMRWEPKWRQQKAVNWGNITDQVFQHILLCCRAFPPLLRELIAFLQLAAGWASAETQSPRVHEPHIPHASVSTGLLLALWNQQFILYQQGWEQTLEGGASCSITTTMVPYGGQKELRLVFSPHNKRCSILCAATVTWGLQFFA